MKNFLAMLMLPFLMFQGSKGGQFAPPENLITEIRITCSDGDIPQRQFTSQRSMEEILWYLRSAAFVEDGNEEIQTVTPLYSVELKHVNGRITVYRQMGSLYLCKGAGRWHRLDPEQGKYLGELYQSLPAGNFQGSTDCIFPLCRV